MKVKNEEIFKYFASKEKEFECKESEIGRQQFFGKQSKGMTPKNPSKYYKFLMRGKWHFDLLSSDLKKAYYDGNWDGWFLLWKDWEGNRNILKSLCAWYKNLPDWIGLEVSECEIEL